MSRLSRFVKLGAAALLLIAVPALGAPAPASAQFAVGLSVNIGPPVLPVYVQPPAPEPNLIWTPGYWGWGPAGYYWVPGTWVAAPQPGYLWTPGYWGYGGGYYAWHGGYWGPHVGFYGGVNYGAGYFGVGYVGGAWAGGAFRYNTAVTNVNTTYVHNTYVNNTVVVNNTSVNRVSYNGGPGGVAAQPTEAEHAAMEEPRLPPTAEQKQHVSTASHDRNMLASVNHGELSPERAAVAQPLSRENRPADYAPLHSEDRQAAQEHVISQPRAASGYATQPQHTQPSYAQHPQSTYSQHPPQSTYSQHPPQSTYSHPQGQPAHPPAPHAPPPPEHDPNK